MNIHVSDVSPQGPNDFRNTLLFLLAFPILVGGVVWLVGNHDWETTSRFVTVIAPKGAQVTIDGKSVEQTAVPKLELSNDKHAYVALTSLGTHDLKVVLHSGHTLEHSMTVEDGSGRLNWQIVHSSTQELGVEAFESSITFGN